MGFTYVSGNKPFSRVFHELKPICIQVCDKPLTTMKIYFKYMIFQSLQHCQLTRSINKMIKFT